MKSNFNFLCLFSPASIDINSFGTSLRKGSAGAVLCVANYPSDVGYAWWLMEHFWAQLGRLANERGGRAFVGFPELRRVSTTLESAPLVPVELQVPTAFNLRAGSIRKFILENNVRTLYLTDREYWTPMYALFRLWGVRSIILHDHVPGERATPSRWKLTLKRMRHTPPLALASADLYVGVSRFVRDRFVQVAGVPEDRCTFVHNGLPPVPAALDSEVRKEFGLPPESRVVVSSGRAAYYKGIDALIKIAGRVIHEYGRRDVYFIHLGDGPHFQEFQRLVEEMELGDRFILAGRRSDVRALLPSCTLALHASRGEAFSLAILEFMAAGLPAVVPDHCGNAEAIQHEASGILYEPGNLDEASAWLVRLLDDTDLRKSIGKNAARRARAAFSLDRMKRRFERIVAPYVQV